MKLYVLAALVSAVLTTACSAPPTAEPPVGVVLPDISNSVATKEIEQRYMEDLTTFIDWVGKQGGMLFADVVGRDALATASVPMAIDFARGAGTPDNPLYTSADFSAKREAAVAEARLLFERKVAPETDLIGAIVAAGRLFDAKGGGRPKVLLLESDMVHAADGPGGNFYSDDLGSSAAIDRRLDTLRSAGLVPDLSGVEVFVAGAGVDGEGKLGQQRILDIEKFWRAYFKATGAVIPPGGYGARLVALQG